jgi:UDP-N-acetylmuramyl pentapeptide phosphotransferase/UDP-N-acetylglucosamine-1-phosphate transferase
MNLLAPPLLAGLASTLAIGAMLRMRTRLPMDHPGHRSLHSTPIPRSGGVGILLGVGLGWLLAWPAPLLPLLGLALGLGALSLADDFRGLSVKLRFGVQIAAAAIFILSQPKLPGGILGAGLAVLALVWMTNLYNFMDGANGLAGGMAVFGFGGYALAAWLGGAPGLAAAAACVAAAALGFLAFNFDPARIFMGDAGSIPLGFLAAGLGLAGWRQGVWPLAFPLLAFSPFIVDASATLAKRLLRGEKVWQAHREHYYQRIILMGLSHRQAALAEYALMLACGGSALALPGAPALAQAAILLGWAAVYAALATPIDAAWRRHKQAL